MRELAIASNMIALARSKHGNKRSAMLRMIMPFLSRDTGDHLANAIHDSDSKQFSKIWDRVKHEIEHKLATACDVSTASCLVEPSTESSSPTKICVKIESENTGNCYMGQTTNEEFVEMFRKVCEFLINRLDPCPLEEEPSQTLTPIEELAARLIALAK